MKDLLKGIIRRVKQPVCTSIDDTQTGSVWQLNGSSSIKCIVLSVSFFLGNDG
jgi:hypothetical protein